MATTTTTPTRRPAAPVQGSGTLAYHRGLYVDAEQLTVSALDRGFLFGDGVFETLRTYGRTPFRLTAHLARLRRSAEALRIRLETPDEDVGRLIDGGIERVQASEVSIRLLLTRGASALAYRLPEAQRPELYAFFSPLPHRPPEIVERGVRAITLLEEKAARFANVKLMNGVPSILALEAARERGAYECLRVSAHGHLLEGFMSNVFAVRGDRLVTPAVSEGLLDGVTRAVVLEQARERGLRTEETSLPLAEALCADELFLTHTSAGVVPVVAVDDRPIGSGRPGDVARGLAAWFEGLPAHVECQS